MAGRASRRGEWGQAQLELIAGVPILLGVAAVILQLLAVGYSQSLADGAAEAGAVALADGREVEVAATEALPGWARERSEVSVERSRVGVLVRPPSLIPGLARHLRVASTAWAWRPSGEG